MVASQGLERLTLEFEVHTKMSLYSFPSKVSSWRCMVADGSFVNPTSGEAGATAVANSALARSGAAMPTGSMTASKPTRRFHRIDQSRRGDMPWLPLIRFGGLRETGQATLRPQ